MAKQKLTDEQVEVEIARLLASDAVKLAKAEMRERYRRRQYMYSLRVMEKRGMEMQELGITEENMAVLLGFTT